MNWSVHPAKYNRTKTTLSLIFIVGFLTYVAIFFGVIFSIIGVIILFASLHSYYFPTHYEVNETMIVIKTIFATQRRELKEFKKVHLGKNGILLSPFKKKTFMNQFRGVFLLLPEKRDDIVNYLNERIIAYQAANNDERGNV